MNGQESPRPEVEIPDSDNSSDTSPPARPPTENDKDYRAHQRLLNMQRWRGDRALSHAFARLAS